MPLNTIIPIGSDGFYHPASESEVISLVKYAYDNNLQIRCRGASHSIARAIYTDPGPGELPVPDKVSEENPPKGPNLNLIFDNLMSLTWIDNEKGIIEVDAGIHLGYDPMDPTGASTLANSLLYQTFLKGWTLSDLGGITHQTVSGFLSTGSAGGTTMYTIEENLLAFRVIDGQGNAEWVEKDSDLFNALGVSLGLLGVIVKVRMQLVPFFNIYGQQITTKTTYKECPIDLFGDGNSTKPNYQQYLEKTPYSRMLWWPQKGVDRVVMWQAIRGINPPVFYPAPYEEFADTNLLTQIEQLGASVMFTTLGNNGFLKTWKKLQPSFKAFYNSIKSGILAVLLTVILYILLFPITLFFSIFKGVLWLLFPTIINLLQPLTKDGKAMLFMDYMWRSLPMDNEAGDILMGTEFTELWIPIEKTKEVMNLLKGFFEQDGRKATGTYSTEIYAGKASNFWLSPSYNRDVIRVDVFWYASNEGNPSVKGGFYEQYWELFEKNNIPFRLHWGKFAPSYDYKHWAEYLRSQTPKWDDFLMLRQQRDPKNIFFTDYFKLRFLGEK